MFCEVKEKMLSISAVIMWIVPAAIVHAVIPPTQKYMSIGGCFDMTTETVLQCAAFEEECEMFWPRDSMRYMSALDLKPYGYSCDASSIPLGKCNSTGQCAITKYSCDDPNDFVLSELKSEECNAEGSFISSTVSSSTSSFVHTQYGGCLHGTTGEIKCALRPEDCSDMEAWISADTALQKKRPGGCKCHDVMVGVCMDGPTIVHLNPMTDTCAISADDCKFHHSYWASMQDVSEHPRLDCRLCPPYVEATDNTTTSTTNDKNEPIGDIGPGIINELNKPSRISATTLSVIIVAIVGLVLMIAIGVIYWKRNNKEHENATNSEGDKKDYPGIVRTLS